MEYGIKMRIRPKIDVTKYKIKNKEIPLGFDNVKILQISDLHNALFGKGQEEIIGITNAVVPDYIFITGDLIDRYKKNINRAMKFVSAIVDVAPTFYVAGNHEWEAGEAGKELWIKLENLGVVVLHDSIVNIERKNSQIQIMGIDDPYSLPGNRSLHIYDRVSSKAFLKRFIKLNKTKEEGYTILLSHRPEFLYFYEKAGIDIVFSGHAHGGQIRLPGIGGVLAPHQGFFPKYAEGVIRKGNTFMVVSRGLGNSCFPFRINNRPEIVVVVLKSAGRE